MAASLAVSITSNLPFAAKVPLLMKATSNDEKPTQAYDLQEISNISKSSLANCESLLNFLLGRLEKKSPCIKIKVLNIMKHLVVNGPLEFQNSLKGHSTTIKQLSSFNGETDPIHGDGFNIKIRDAATKLELLLFDVDNPEVEIMYQSMVAPKQSGIKMEGFGNTIVQPKKEPSFSDLIKKVESKVTDIIYYNPKQETHQNFEPIESIKPRYIPVHITLDDHQKLKDNKDYYEHEICDHKQVKKVDTVCHYYEKKIVNDITSEGGIRNTPSKDALKEFVNKSTSLDFQVILQVLNEKLQHPSTTVQLKSLCIIEYLLRCDLDNILHSINDNCTHIKTLVYSEDPTIQSKTNKILLTISCGVKLQKSNIDNDVVQPPSYNAATELPSLVRIEDREGKEVKSTNELQSLFSGMSFASVTSAAATNVVTKRPVLVPDLLGELVESDVQQTGCLRSEKPTDIFDTLTELDNLSQRTINSHESGISDHRTPDTKNMIVSLESKEQDLCSNTSGTDAVHLQNNRTAEAKTINNLLTNTQASAYAVPYSSLSEHTPANRNTTNSLSSERRPFPKDIKPDEGGFAFLRKSSKKDAFSFVNDEIAASKTRPK